MEEKEGEEERGKERRGGQGKTSMSFNNSSSQIKGKDFVPISFPSRVFPLNFSKEDRTLVSSCWTAPLFLSS